MKKMLSVVMALLLITGVVYAEIPAKVGILYDIKDSETYEVAGSAIVKDVAGIKNLDIDALIGGEIETMLSNDDKIALTGISYNYDLNDKLSAGIGVAVGLKRIEKLEEHRLGESKAGIYGVITYAF